MTSPQDIYNRLPTLQDARTAFPRFPNIDNSNISERLRQLFCEEPWRSYGVCLLHRHTTLNAGELMVSRGNITQPEVIDPATVYPQGWVVTADGGFPFEYRAGPPPPPVTPQDLPKDLRAAFWAIMQENNISAGIGIFFTWPETTGRLWREITEGRKNIVEEIQTGQVMEGMMQTSWVVQPNFGDPLPSLRPTMQPFGICIVTQATHLIGIVSEDKPSTTMTT